MQFYVQSSLHYQVNAPSSILCLLSCVRSEGQQVSGENFQLSRHADRNDLEVGLTDNRFTRIDVYESGDFSIQYSATVSTTVHIHEDVGSAIGGIQDLDASVIPFLFPSRYAPADRLRTLATELFGHIKGSLNQAIAIEDWLYENITYTSGSSHEQTWALDTYEQGEGVCRDFAHLGIALCRALTIPARYATVYAFQLNPQDFHAVFEVFVGGAWYLIDGTRLAPLNGMVRIALGRDASDAAVASLFGPINGTGVEVDTMISADETEAFSPINRDDLRQRNQVIALG